MENAVALALLVSAALLLIRQVPPTRAQVFCRSQFTLANEACNMRSLVPGARRPGLPREQLNETSLVATATATDGGGDKQVLQSRNQDDDDEGGSGRQSSRHHHRRYSDDEDPRDTACCRRIISLDNSCVCQATARLPPFMNSVRHSIKLTPIQGCEVTFDCPGSLF